MRTGVCDENAALQGQGPGESGVRLFRLSSQTTRECTKLNRSMRLHGRDQQLRLQLRPCVYRAEGLARRDDGGEGADLADFEAGSTAQRVAREAPDLEAVGGHQVQAHLEGHVLHGKVCSDQADPGRLLLLVGGQLTCTE